MLYTFPASGRRIFVFETGESSEELMSSAQDEGFKKIHLLIFETDLNLTNNSRMVMCRLQLASRKIQKAMDHHFRIMVCPDQSCPQSVRESVFLFGGFLILAQGLDAYCVAASFADFAEQDLLSSTQDERRSTVLDCWQALQHVRDIGWMSWKDGTDDHNQPFLVDEFLHYAHSINGSIHIVAPEQLLLFTSPVDMPDQQQWTVVVSDDDGSCSRRFSPAFYADLFADLGVAAVVCLTESTTSSAAFTARDIEARDLRHEGSGSLLRTLDGLLSLSRGAEVSGGIAVHGGGEAEWMSETSMLVATWLVSRAGFGERAAYGWLQLLCPWLPMPGAVRVGRRREANGTRASVLPAQSCYSTRDGRSAPPPADRSEEG